MFLLLLTSTIAISHLDFSGLGSCNYIYTLVQNNHMFGVNVVCLSFKINTKLGLWLRLECSLDSLSIDSAHVIYVAEGHNVGAERQSSVMTLRKPIVTWII